MSSEPWWVLALIVKFEDEHSFNTTCDEHVLLIVEVSLCYEADNFHVVRWFDHNVQLIQENKLEVACDHQVQLNRHRERR